MITDAKRAPASTLAGLAGKYLSLTTYRRDGSGVPTPVWFVKDIDGVFVQTSSCSHKVRRIERDPRVSVAACTARGTVRSEPVPGVAELVPWSDRVERMFREKYRADLVFIKPVRAIQRFVRRGGLQDDQVLLHITRT